MDKKYNFVYMGIYSVFALTDDLGFLTAESICCTARILLKHNKSFVWREKITVLFNSD